MKLLLDQNLSPKLVGRLADLFPGFSHVQSAGLDWENKEDATRFSFRKVRAPNNLLQQTAHAKGGASSHNVKPA